MDRIKLDKNMLRLPHGSKWRGGNRCTSINLSRETRDAIDELVPVKYRSAWVERWCRLGLAIQSGERIDEWAAWFADASNKSIAGWTAFGFLADRVWEHIE